MRTQAPGSTHNERITRVTFVTNDVAVVDGEAKIEGMQDHDPSAGPYVHRFVDILVKRAGTSAVNQVRAW